MANKDQRRGNRETRKPKQAKTKTQVADSPFVLKSGKSVFSSTAKK